MTDVAKDTDRARTTAAAANEPGAKPRAEAGPAAGRPGTGRLGDVEPSLADPEPTLAL